MSIHPKFDSEHSNCGNCAAFSPWDDSVNGCLPPGTCHRHAPKPAAILIHHERGGNHDGADPAETDPSGFCWPKVDDEQWCMEWFPKKDPPIPTDEAQWHEFVDVVSSLSIRAARVIRILGITSFEQLDGLPDAQILCMPNTGDMTLHLIRATRRAFSGWNKS